MRSDNRQQDRFFELLKPELARLQGFCQKLSGNPDQGDDLVQDALYDAWKGFGRLRDEAAFQSWLYQIVINRYRTSLRRLKKQAGSTTSLTDDVADTEQSHARVVHERLSIALGCLSADDRALVTLHELEGWSYAELAGLLGKREGALRTRLTRCRNRMREELRRHLDGIAEGGSESGATQKCAVVKYEEN